MKVDINIGYAFTSLKKKPMTSEYASRLYPDNEEPSGFDLGATCSYVCPICNGRNVFVEDFRGVPQTWLCIYCKEKIGNDRLINLMNNYKCKRLSEL